MGVSLHKRSDFCQHCFLKPEATVISKNTFQVSFFSFSDTQYHTLRMQHFKIMLSDTCPCYLHKICLENRDS